MNKTWESARRIAINLAILTLPTLILLVTASELTFRYILPASEHPYTIFDQIHRIPRFDLDGPRSGQITLFRTGLPGAHWLVNNEGWISDIDYLAGTARNRPLIAVIGDSYVEGLQVDVGQRLVEVLRSSVGAHFEVYSFGMSGAPLSQYLQISRYVQANYRPDVMVFLLVSNDFAESLFRWSNVTSFLTLTEQEGVTAEVAPTPPRFKSISRAELVRTIMDYSATARYIRFNAKISFASLRQSIRNTVGSIFGGDSSEVTPPREFTAFGDISYSEEVEKAIHYVIKTVRSENPDTELIFMIDAPRWDIYDGKDPRQGGEWWVHDVVRKACEENRCRFIELTDVFLASYTLDGRPFNFSFDYHWDRYGHAVAASVLHDSLEEFGIYPAQHELSPADAPSSLSLPADTSRLSPMAETE